MVRPRKPILEKLSQRLQYWVTVCERERIAHEAQERGLTVSEHTRRMMLSPKHALALHLPKPNVQTAIDLRRLGVRLEQIAGAWEDIAELPELVEIVDGLADQLLSPEEVKS
jgi:hypothetical protein